jgi:NADH-quinone oxidoreductase subunit A
MSSSTLLSLLDRQDYSTLFTVVAASLALSAVILALSLLLAIRTPDPEKSSAYECGFEPFEDARNRFDIRFSIVAILFLIFDVEVAYLFPWARTLGRTGATAYAAVVLFLVLLTVGFLYEVVKGALTQQ